MKKMWLGRTDGSTDSAADGFNSSILVDGRMFREDIRGSIAHAKMLADCGIISSADCRAITEGLSGILSDMESGALGVDPTAEDIHMFIEQTLTERIGDVGKKLHTARSRNDQVALDMRLYLRGEVDSITAMIKEFIGVLCARAEEHKGAVMPGYTHLQRAQPVTFGAHMCAYAAMLLRDCQRLADCKKRIDISPIGSCALAGTELPTDRRAESLSLGFSDICFNSLDGVSDRDFCIELVSALAIFMMHLSRLAEELVMWSSWEFAFVELPDEFTTGSSIMPQKKNPDMAELARGKTGRVYGDLIALLTVMKGLPLAYNKDMQEDKESVFDSVDTVKACLEVFTPMVAGMTVRTENMYNAAKKGFINATDLADYLVRKGVPFRESYKISGRAVAKCIADGITLESLSLEEYRELSPLFDEGVYSAIDLDNCVKRRTSEGGVAASSVEKQLEYIKNALENG